MVTIHFGIWAISDKEHSFSSGGHLATVLSTITGEIWLGLLERIFNTSLYYHGWTCCRTMRNAFIFRVVIPSSKTDQCKNNNFLQAQHSMLDKAITPA